MKQDQRRGAILGQVTWAVRRPVPVLVVLGISLIAGCAGLATPTPRIVTPTPQSTVPAEAATSTPVPVATLTPTATPSVVATQTSTAEPPLDPERLVALTDTGLAAIHAQVGPARVLCVRYEDTDADGTPEWLALAQRQGSAAPRLDGVVLDDGVVHTLPAASPKPGTPDIGLGEYATCEVEVRDVNADGITEIAVFGHATGNRTLLHLFAWDDTEYRRIGVFSGNAGVAFHDEDGDLEEEIWEGYRMKAAPTITWHVVYTWEQNTYGWTSDTYSWTYDDRPQSYPTHQPDLAVIAFYLALDERDLPGAYGLMLPQGQPQYEDWAVGYATTLQVRAGDVHTIPAETGASRAGVSAMVRAWDNQGGVIIGRLWNVEWDTALTDDGWRLLSSTAELLDEWKADYWPQGSP